MCAAAPLAPSSDVTPSLFITFAEACFPAGPERIVLDGGAAWPFISAALCRRHGFAVSAQPTAVHTPFGPFETTGVARASFSFLGTSLELLCAVVPTDAFSLLLPAPVHRSLGLVIDNHNGVVSRIGHCQPLFFAAPSLSSSDRPNYTSSGQAALPPPAGPPASPAPAAPAALAAVAVAPDLFRPGWTKEQAAWDAIFTLPTRDSIAARVTLGAGLSSSLQSSQHARVVAELMLRPRLAREYNQNEPPPLRILPLRLPFRDGAQIAYQSQWHRSPAELNIIDEQARSWIARGVAERSTSLGNLPIMAVPKGNGKHRLVLDSRAVNAQLQAVSCDPPSIPSVRAFLSSARRLTVLDCGSFYHSFTLASDMRPWFAFNAGRLGKLQMTRMPQGASVSPAIANAFLQLLLRDVADRAVVYVDNIYIASPTDSLDDHWSTVSTVLDRLDAANIVVNLSSSFWCGVRDVPVLGFLWSPGLTRLPDERITDVLAQPRPKTLKQMRSFCAAVTQLATYTPDAQRLATPFHRLCGTSKPIKWTSELLDAWELLRNVIARALVLVYPQKGDRMVVRSDASEVGWGGVLLVQRNGRDLPCAFVSRAWRGAEGRWNPVEREARALVETAKRLQPYTRLDEDVIYETDSSAGAGILTHAGADRLGDEGRRLAELQVKPHQLRHVPGVHNVWADWASRAPVVVDSNDTPLALVGAPLSAHSETSTKDTQTLDPAPARPAKASSATTGPPGGDTATNVSASFQGGDAIPVAAAWPAAGFPDAIRKLPVVTREAQERDPILGPIMALHRRMVSHRNGDPIELDSANLLALRRYALGDDGILRWLEMATRHRGARRPADVPVHAVVAVPAALEQAVLEFYHRVAAHPGHARFVARLRSRVHFPDLPAKAAAYSASCQVCQSRGPRREPASGKGARSYADVGEHLYADVGDASSLLQLPPGQGLFVALVDQSSRMIAAAPLTSRSSQALVAAIHAAWVRPYGPPRLLTVDNALEFSSAALERYCTQQGIRLVHTHPYNAPANIAETVVAKLKTGLRRAHADAGLAGETPSWEMLLENVITAWNSTHSEQAQAIPEHIFFGRLRRQASDSLQPAPLDIGRANAEPRGGDVAVVIRAPAPADPDAPRAFTFLDADARYVVHPPGTYVWALSPPDSPAARGRYRVHGPYKIRERVSETTYALDDVHNRPVQGTIHGRYLVPFIGDQAAALNSSVPWQTAVGRQAANLGRSHRL